MELQTAIESRRSVREYVARPVEKEKLVAILEAAQLAPTWKNSQTPRYYVAAGEALPAVRGALPEGNRKKTADAAVLIVQTFVKDVSGFNTAAGTPDNELGNGWGAYDAGLQAQTLLLKATELGLSTLVMGLRDAEALREALDIPETEIVTAVIAVGYSEADPPMRPRKPLEEIAKFV